MAREITEVHTFSRDDLLQVAKQIAKGKIVSTFYVGEFMDQVAEYLPDGSVRVQTTHMPSPDGLEGWRFKALYGK